MDLLITLKVYENLLPFRILPYNQKLELPRNEQLTVLQESTAQLFSFEWSHFRIFSKDSKIRITFYSIISRLKS